MRLRDDEIRELAPKVRGMIWRQFSTVSPALADPDDLFQCAMIAVLRHAERYDPAHGASFSTWALLKAYRGVQDALRSMQPGFRHESGGLQVVASLDQPLSDEPGGALGEVIPDEEFEFPDPFVPLALARALEALPLDVQSAIAMRFEDDMTLLEIAEVFGVTESRASQMVTRGLRDLERDAELAEAVA